MAAASSGDEIAPAIRIAGGAVFGGPLGMSLAAGGILIEAGQHGSFVDEKPQQPVRAVAESTDTEPFRGGWIVNAALTGRLPPWSRTNASPAGTPSAGEAVARQEMPRGGWMIAQAYGVPDVSLRSRVDMVI